MKQTVNYRLLIAPSLESTSWPNTLYVLRLCGGDGDGWAPSVIFLVAQAPAHTDGESWEDNRIERQYHEQQWFHHCREVIQAKEVAIRSWWVRKTKNCTVHSVGRSKASISVGFFVVRKWVYSCTCYDPPIGRRTHWKIVKSNRGVQINCKQLLKWRKQIKRSATPAPCLSRRRSLRIKAEHVLYPPSRSTLQLQTRIFKVSVQNLPLISKGNNVNTNGTSFLTDCKVISFWQ